MSFDITEIPSETLCEAGRRLQAAHDYIETAGFNISVYSPYRESGACCYIGSVKHVAEDEDFHSPWTGDGLPLEGSKKITAASRAALLVMDAIAEGEGYGRDEWNEWKYPGRAVEMMGLANEGEKEAEKALSVFREALRNVFTELERRDYKGDTK